MEMEMKDELGIAAERLSAAAISLEQAVERLTVRQSAFAADAEATIGRVVAAVEERREAELEAQLAAAEQKIAELEAKQSVAATAACRKTLPSLLAKQGVTLDSLEAGTLDAALASLGLEQRIAVKAQLLRAGLLG